jgi:hypothetical protein
MTAALTTRSSTTPAAINARGRPRKDCSRVSGRAWLSLSEPVGDKHTTGYRFINTMEQPDHLSESTKPSSSEHFALEELLTLTIEAIVSSLNRAITSPATSSTAEPLNSFRNPVSSSRKSKLSFSNIHTVDQSPTSKMQFSLIKSVDFSDTQSA